MLNEMISRLFLMSIILMRDTFFQHVYHSIFFIFLLALNCSTTLKSINSPLNEKSHVEIYSILFKNFIEIKYTNMEKKRVNYVD